MVEQNHKLYAGSRDDIADMYGSPDDRGDYGVRGPLRTTVEVEPVVAPALPEQLNLFPQPSDVPVRAASTAPVEARRAKPGSLAMTPEEMAAAPPAQDIKVDRPFENFANPGGRSRHGFEHEMKQLLTPRTKR